MEKKNKFRQLSLTVICCLTLIAVSFLFSCNNNSRKKETSDTTTTMVPYVDTITNLRIQPSEDQQDDSILTVAMKEIEMNTPNSVWINETYNVTLTGDQLRSIFSAGAGALGPIVALELKFHMKNFRFSVKARGLNATGQATEWLKMDHTDPNNRTVVRNVNNLKREKQIITRGELKWFLGLPTSTTDPIPLDAFVDMNFVANRNPHPREPARNNIYLNYSGMVMNAKNKSKKDFNDGFTNPSPPFTAPCDGQDCDVPTKFSPHYDKYLKDSINRK